MSLSARRAWIEIIFFVITAANFPVALCSESVDWNRSKNFYGMVDKRVALCSESVDWNLQKCVLALNTIVALCSESVDWNDIDRASRPIFFSRSLLGERGLKSLTVALLITGAYCRSLLGERGLKYLHRVHVPMVYIRSLSARRAWIEIRMERGNMSIVQVALCSESVDWNFCLWWTWAKYSSLSARRAWIEISLNLGDAISGQVALCSESVDWN